MENFEWKQEYNAVFMVFVAGYLARPDLVTFLKRAQAQLETRAGPSRRKSKPGSFIFLFENVLADEEKRAPEKGQRFRTGRQLEGIFAEAGLLIHDQSGLKQMPGHRQEVQVWALY